MTENSSDTRTRLRAVFLATVMVLSVFGVASGTVAASDELETTATAPDSFNTTQTVNRTTVAPGDKIAVSVTLENATSNTSSLAANASLPSGWTVNKFTAANPQPSGTSSAGILWSGKPSDSFWTPESTTFTATYVVQVPTGASAGEYDVGTDMNYFNGTAWWSNKSTNVTVQQTPELTLTGGSVVPSTVDEGATVTHNASLTFENVSADGNTDTFQVIFPDSVRGNNLSANSANVTNLSDGSDVSITGSVNQVDGPDGDGFNDTLTFDVSPDSNGTIDVAVNVSVDVTWPNVSVNTTETIRVAAQDSSTGSVGPVDAADVTVVSLSNFPVTIQGADAGEFPTIRTFVSVNTTAGANGNLTQSNFTVYEDGVKQSITSVNFTSNETQTDLDIVYVFDRSGSMGDDINELRRQIKGVSNQLNESGRDVRFGLVTFSDDYGRYDQNMTRNVTKLENALDSVSAGGSTERNYDAIDKALQLEFRGSAQKVLIDITDENNDPGDVNQTQAARAIQERGVNYVAISPDFGPTSSATDEDGSTVNPYADEDDENGTGLDPANNHPGDKDKRILAERIGGQWFAFDNTNFTKAINDITDRLASTYIVEYDTTNTVRTGNPRVVNVTVDDPDQGVNSTVGQYIPPRADITGVDTTGFPTINATIDVNTTEGKAGNLGLDNFNISEDGNEQSIQDLRFDSTNGTYVIEYATPDPVENGTSREIEVTVSLETGGTIVVTEQYRAPGTPSNLLPNVSFTVSPSNPSTGETVMFNASGSEDPDGTIVEYRWDLNGNGTYDVNTTSPTVNFSYSTAANINVELQVVDDGGATNSTSQVVSVQGDQTVSSGQPGFGIAVAVIALIAVVLFARRRQ